MSLILTNKTVRHGLWTTGLFDCCEEPVSCVEAYFCPWCSVSAQHNRLYNNQVGVDIGCCFIMCCIDACFTYGCATCCTSMKHRGEIRRRYGIPDDSCADCCVVCLCMSCATAQQYREMCYRGLYPGGMCVSPPIGTPMGVNQPQTTLVVPSPTQGVVIQQTTTYGYNQQPGYGNAPPPPQQGGYFAPQQQAYTQQQPSYAAQPYPPQPATGYPPQTAATGYSPQPATSYPPQMATGYPPQQQTYPQQGYAQQPAQPGYAPQSPHCQPSPYGQPAKEY